MFVSPFLHIMDEEKNVLHILLLSFSTSHVKKIV